METPAPVNLNALSGILANAKKVMNKIETEKPIKSNGSDGYSSSVNESHGYNEADEKEMPNYQTQPNGEPALDPTRVFDYSEEQVMASNLPQNVKEAMIKNRIPRASLGGTLSKEDIEFINPKAKQAQPQPRRLVESVQSNNSDMITISKTQLQEMIDSSMINFLKNNYEKQITEAAITKTINLLIKEGKIGVKKKTL